MAFLLLQERYTTYGGEQVSISLTSLQSPHLHLPILIRVFSLSSTTQPVANSTTWDSCEAVNTSLPILTTSASQHHTSVPTPALTETFSTMILLHQECWSCAKVEKVGLCFSIQRSMLLCVDMLAPPK